MAPNAYAANSTQSKKMIVIFADGKVNNDIIIKANGTVSKEYKHLNALAVTLPENSINALAHAPGVVRVEQDFEVKASGKPAPAPAPAQTIEWGVSKINAPTAWSHTTGAGVKIAVLDTGIATHPDLKNVAGGVAFTGSSYVDDNGHYQYESRFSKLF